MLDGKRIILGVTGGIAAYKAAFLLRAFQKAGAEVRATLTPSATRFIGVETFSALTRTEVPVEVFSGQSPDPEAWTRHIHWGEWADLFVVAPCTANTLAKIVHGMSDNMLTSLALSVRCPLLICPTMDGEMYEAPATKANLKKAHKLGLHLLEPGSGYLASGLEGKGRLPEVDDILERADQIITRQQTAHQPLQGKKVVVTGGPTREHIDPVRFISNPSSGKMGLAMAEAAHEMGGEVTFIHGPISLELPPYLSTEAIESAEQMFEAVKTHADADVIVMAAAVSDFKPAKRANHKVKKVEAERSIPLEANPDILKWLGEHKREGQTLIGFAMETENLLENARKKLESKNADYIAANSLVEEGSGFQGDTNRITLISPESESTITGTKKKVSQSIFMEILNNQ